MYGVSSLDVLHPAPAATIMIAGLLFSPLTPGCAHTLRNCTTSSSYASGKKKTYERPAYNLVCLRNRTIRIWAQLIANPPYNTAPKMSAIYDPALSNCTPVTLSAAGQMDSQLSADSDIRISCRALADQQGVDNFCLVCEEESFARRIKALDFSGAKLTDAQVAQLISDGVARCSNIIELNLSYIPLSHKAVAALCTMINVKISGDL